MLYSMFAKGSVANEAANVSIFSTEEMKVADHLGSQSAEITSS